MRPMSAPSLHGVCLSCSDWLTSHGTPRRGPCRLTRREITKHKCVCHMFESISSLGASGVRVLEVI